MNHRESKLWQQLTGGSARTDLSRRRQQENYERHVRDGNDAVRNNPQQR